MTDPLTETPRVPREVTPRTPRVRLGLVMIATAVLLVAAGTLGHLNPGDRVWTHRMLDHPYLFGVLAIVLLAAAIACMFPERPGVTVFGLGGGLAAAVSWSAVGAMSNTFSPDEVAVVSAPSGAGVAYEAVVRATSDGIIDPAWTVAIRQTSRGLADREWYVGCISGDAPNESFDHVVWQSRRQLVVTLRHGTVVVRVDPATGEPQLPAGEVWHTC